MYDAEPMAMRAVNIQLPLAMKSNSGAKLNKLPMQLKIQIVPKIKEKTTAIKTMASHAILILRSLMTSLMNSVIFFISFTCMRLFWLRDEFLIHALCGARRDYTYGD